MTPRSGRPFAILAFVLAVLAYYTTEISPQWAINPDYNYGWAVPFLFLFLLWRRWQTRPATAPARSQMAAAACGAALALAILPVRLIKEANQDWLLPAWAATFLAMGLFLTGAYLAGGAPWARHFAPAILFLVTAAPWPYFLEHRIVLGLTGVVTKVATEFLVLWGIPAVQLGNVIEVSTGLVGIDEACSGIRSLQAVVMISLFLGAQFGLTALRTLFLLAAGAALAFGCNVVRSTALSVIAATQGMARMKGWHDTLGIAVLLACFAGVWLLARLLARPPADGPGASGRGGEESAFSPHRISVAAVAALIVWIPAAWLLTEAWYRAHEGGLAGARLRDWRVHWPDANPTFGTRAISEESRALLLYDEGSSAAWTEVDGSRWQAYYFRWRPGLKAAQAAIDHVPEVCLPSAGMSLVSNAGDERFKVSTLEIPFARYEFDDHGRTLYVFRCVSNDLTARAPGQPSPINWSRTDRFARVLQGKRQRSDQRILEVAILGYDNQAEADTAFRRVLEKLIRT